MAAAAVLIKHSKRLEKRHFVLSVIQYRTEKKNVNNLSEHTKIKKRGKEREKSKSESEIDVGVRMVIFVTSSVSDKTAFHYNNS